MADTGDDGSEKLSPEEKKLVDSMVDKLGKHLRKPLSEKIENDRHYFLSTYNPEFVEQLDPFIRQFFVVKEGKSFPAIDIGSSRGVQTIQMALHFRKPFISGHLIWYPTDCLEGNDGGTLEEYTRETLRYHIQETKDIRDNPMFTDRNGQIVFKDDCVVLDGLRSAQYNGKRGIIRGPDATTNGRFAVQLSRDKDNVKSFKQNNIAYMGEISAANACLRMLRVDRTDVDFFEGLLRRSCELDILEKDTWSNVEYLGGRCALVTCTSLLSCLGHRNPDAWKDTMEFASKMLCKGGYLAQFDTYRFGDNPMPDAGDFGGIPAMEAYSEERSLGLKLVKSNIPSDDLKNKLFVWQKK